MFEDNQTSKQGWMNKINNEDFRKEFFGHQKRATLRLEEGHINKKNVSEDFISFERVGSTNGRRFTHKTIVLFVLVLSCVVVLAVAGTVIFIFSKPDCNTSISNLMNITAPPTNPSRRTTPSAAFSTANSPQTKTTKISSATTAQTTTIKTSATTTTTPTTTTQATVTTTTETPVIITKPSTTTTIPIPTTQAPAITTTGTSNIITIPSTTTTIPTTTTQAPATTTTGTSNIITIPSTTTNSPISVATQTVTKPTLPTSAATTISTEILSTTTSTPLATTFFPPSYDYFYQ